MALVRFPTFASNHLVSHDPHPFMKEGAGMKLLFEAYRFAAIAANAPPVPVARRPLDDEHVLCAWGLTLMRGVVWFGHLPLSLAVRIGPLWPSLA